jgi:hypothetical protein
VKTTCDPVSGWTLVESLTHPFYRHSWFKDGAECFARYMRVFRVGTQAEADITYYGFGTQVARGAHTSSGDYVLCPEAGSFQLRATSAECAAWLALLEFESSCSSTTPGECS